MNRRIWTFIKITAGCTLLSCVLGVALDLVTANVAVEYFTVHHPHVVDSKSPWVMALVWGIGASWWFGLVAGGILALVNHFKRPSVPAETVLKRVARMCVSLWLIFMSILGSMYLLMGWILPVTKPTYGSDRRILAVAITHMGEYVLGAIACAILVRWCLKFKSTEAVDQET